LKSVPSWGNTAIPALPSTVSDSPSTRNGRGDLHRAAGHLGVLAARTRVGCDVPGVGADRGVLGEQQPELIATEPGDGVLGAQDLPHPWADLLQQQVAVVVPEGVVDLLEPIQVQQHHPDTSPRTQRRLDLLGERQPVRQAGQ